MVAPGWINAAKSIQIKEQKCYKGKAIPLVIAPTDAIESKDEMMQWAKENASSLALELKEIGAILFRGFPLNGAQDFSDFVEALGVEPLPYIGGMTLSHLGAAVRNVIYKDVHTTNESPPDQPIPFHQYIYF